MQGEQADPAGHMDCVLLRMPPVLSYLVGDIVDGDDPIEQDQRDEDQNPQR